MNSITRKSDSSQPAAETAVYLFDDWFDPIETGVRDRVREFRCDDAGLPQRCTFHGLRKAGCRRLAEAGCSANEIAAWSGQSLARGGALHARRRSSAARPQCAGTNGRRSKRARERERVAGSHMTERTKQEMEAEARELMRQSRERRERGYASEADEKAAAAFDTSWPTIAERWKEGRSPAHARREERTPMKTLVAAIVLAAMIAPAHADDSNWLKALLEFIDMLDRSWVGTVSRNYDPNGWNGVWPKPGMVKPGMVIYFEPGGY